MAKITRKTQKIFGGNSSNNGQYGSARANTFVLDNDPDVIQALPAWEQGINAATVSGELLPALEETQGVDYVITRQISYILQEGLPEYDSGTTYYINSIVKEPGSVSLYKSIADDNIGNPLSNPSFWVLLVNLDSINVKDNYTASSAPTAGDDQTQGYSEGSKWYYDGDIWLCVNNTVGAAVWVDTGVNLDDLGALAFQNSIPNFIGDSGSGGTSGLVPAPGAGSAAADYFLHASGSFMALPSSGFYKQTIITAIGTTAFLKNSKTKFLKARLQAAGGIADIWNPGTPNRLSHASATGGYSEKIYAASDLLASENVVLGATSTVENSNNSTFKGMICGNGGRQVGGSATGGDRNVSGTAGVISATQFQCMTSNGSLFGGGVTIISGSGTVTTPGAGGVVLSSTNGLTSNGGPPIFIIEEFG